MVKIKVKELYIFYKFQHTKTFIYISRDNHQSPYQNLYNIFKDQLMPKVFNNQNEDTSSDVECAICYAYKLEHVELGLLTPDVICTNDQCNRGFHPTCISEVNQTKKLPPLPPPSHTHIRILPLYGKVKYTN